MKSLDSDNKKSAEKAPEVKEEVKEEVIDFSKVEIEPMFKDFVDFDSFSKCDFRAVKGSASARRLSWDKGGFPSVPSASIPAGVVCTVRGVALRSSGTAVAKVCDGITVRAAANARRLPGKGRTERFAGTAECLVENVRVATGRARQKKATCGPEPSGPHVAFCSGAVSIFLRKSSP